MKLLRYPNTPLHAQQSDNVRGDGDELHHGGGDGFEVIEVDDLPESERKELRWFESEIVLGMLVGVLFLAAGLAVWIFMRRRHRKLLSTEERRSRSNLPCPHASSDKASDARKRKISTVSAPGLRNGVVHSLNVLDGTVKHAQTAPTLVVPVAHGFPAKSVDCLTPWEPYLLGVPGKETRARRRSVSLRSDSDSDVDTIGPGSVSTSPAGPEPGPRQPRTSEDEEPTRKRSVTFNAVVEEVQILR